MRRMRAFCGSIWSTATVTPSRAGGPKGPLPATHAAPLAAAAVACRAAPSELAQCAGPRGPWQRAQAAQARSLTQALLKLANEPAPGQAPAFVRHASCPAPKWPRLFWDHGMPSATPHHHAPATPFHTHPKPYPHSQVAPLGAQLHLHRGQLRVLLLLVRHFYLTRPSPARQPFPTVVGRSAMQCCRACGRVHAGPLLLAVSAGLAPAATRGWFACCGARCTA